MHIHINKAIALVLLTTFVMMGCGSDATKGIGPGQPGQPGKQGQQSELDVTTIEIEIENAEELAKIGNNDTYTFDKNYKLTKDITLAGEWTPIGFNKTDTTVNDVKNNQNPRRFTGNFDGNNKTITGLNIRKDGASYVGLFSSVQNNTIKDLTIQVVEIKGATEVGALAGKSSATTITNVNIEAPDDKITAKVRTLGLLIGLADGGTISNSHATGNITMSGSNIGGLVGRAIGTVISDSYATSNITVKGSNIGGLVGETIGGIISNSYTISDITGETRVGGLVGYASHSIIEKSYAKGKKVTGNTEVGGLVGGTSGGILISYSYATSDVTGTVLITSTNRNSQFIGGLVGKLGARGTIKKSYAKGNVTVTDEASGSSLGGLVGWARESIIEECYTTGNVAGLGNIGGLVGWALGGNIINNSYAIGEITGDGRVGGLLGFAGAVKLSNSYATGKITGNDDKVGGLLGDGPLLIYSSYFDITGTGKDADQGSGSNTSSNGFLGIEKTSITKTTFTTAITDVAAQWSDTIWTFVAGEWPTLTDNPPVP